MNDRELLQMALDALLENTTDPYVEPELAAQQDAAIKALRARLAQLEAEEDYGSIANKQLASLKAATKETFEDAAVRAVHKLYTAPPQREWMEQERAVGYREGHQAALKQRVWQGLTNDEVADFVLFHAVVDEECVRAIESKLKEKNGG